MADDHENKELDLEQGPTLSPDNDFMSELKSIIFQGDQQIVEGETESADQPVSEDRDLSDLSPDALANAPVEPEKVSYPKLDELIASIDEELDGVPVAADLIDDTDVQPEQIIEQHLVFTIAERKYAVPTANVIEIGRLLNATQIPNMPSWLVGVTNRRGDILSVVNLREFLGIDPNPTDSTRMLVVRTQDDELTTGLIVDQVNGMLNMVTDQMELPTDLVGPDAIPYLRGFCEHKLDVVAILDLEALLASSEMNQFEMV